MRFIGHGGDLLACHSQFWIEPPRKLTFFISDNSAGAEQKAAPSSGLRVLVRPLRAITKLKFLIVVLSCVYLGWFLLYFHLIGSATRY